MKKIFLIGILLLSSFFIFSEKKVWKDPNAKGLFPLDANGKIIYTEVIEMPNIAKDALYSRAYEWFAKTFNSAQNVIQMQDKEAGKIIGKGIFDDMNSPGPLGMAGVKGYMKFTISIYLKDGKYKYEITDFVHEGIWTGEPYGDPSNGGALENEKPDCGRSVISLGKWEKVKIKANERALLLIESLNKAMTVEVAGDNW